MSRFVKGGTDILTLKNGDTLVVKKRLNVGEDRARYSRMRGDRMRVHICTVVAYLLDWQLKDDRPPILGLSDDDKEAVIDNLDPDDFDEIRDAITAHIDAQQQARAAEKKARDGVSELSATSPSPVTSAGASSGSTS